MATFLTTRGTTAAVEQLILHARNRLVLISPYIQLAGVAKSRIEEALRRGVEVILVCREKDLKQEERDQIMALRRVKLYFLPDLHAKCYCNEEKLIVSSLNLYAFSEQNNREMSVELSRTTDAEAFVEALREVNSILAAAVEHRPSTLSRLVSAFAPPREQTRTSRGFCIRCQDNLPYQPDRPLCRDCFKSWAVWENPDYEEKVCHGCGTRHRSTMAKPLCRPCYRADASMN
jgi:phosphatidylserine/phosphatidylglycerophosphate/cardiolipin synthase-like enzyme